MDLILGWSFFVYPVVVSMGFNSLGECDCFANEDGGTYCVLPYSLGFSEAEECTGFGPFSVENGAVLAAAAAVAIYGFGIPLTYATLLLCNRESVVGEKPPTALGAQLSLLFAEYESRVFYWELIETSKKLVLTGVLAALLHAWIAHAAIPRDRPRVRRADTPGADHAV